MQSYHVHIEPKTEGFHLNLREVWEYRDLIGLLTNKTFTLTYKQTILGPAWIIINPLLSSIIYLFIFGIVAGISTDGVPRILFYLSGTAIWGLFSQVLSTNSSTFNANANLFGKVYFPRLTVPISNMLASLIRFGIQMIIVAVLLIYYTATGDVHPRWELWPLIPFALLHLCVLGMGIGIILSSFTTKYRDLQILVSFGLQLLMYGTPVVYPLSQLPDGILRTLVVFNPVTSPVEVIRTALLGAGSIEMLPLAVSLAVTAICFVFGVLIFNHVEKTFIDTV